MAITHNSLKAKCAELGITIRQLCDAAGVPEATVSAWKRKEPGSIQTLRKLESALERIHRQRMEDSEA